MIKNFNDLTGWINLIQSTSIKDNQFTVAQNVFYNNAKQLQTRRGYRKFGSSMWASPATSYFFYQRDDTLARIAVCHAGGKFYTYNEWTGDRDQVYANYIEHETRTGETNKRTRWDFCVYKNVIYMCDGVNPYASYDGTTHTIINTTSIWTTTADNTTDFLTKTTHGLNNNDEVYITTSGTMPTGLVAYQVYYVVNKTTNTFQVASEKNWTYINFTTNGTGTLTTIKLNEPRTRYIQYLGDRIYTAWDDANPSSMYYTNAAPADGTNINQNTVVVWWDEAGVINWLNEYSQIVIAFKDQRTYAVNVATPSIDTIDTQMGGYADRCTTSVNNWLVFFNERWIDTLITRDGVSGASAISSKPLSDNVRELTKKIAEDYYNSSCAYFIKKLNNYYFSFDTNGDDRPDTTLVYNSLTGAWTQYKFPNIYDYGYYINEDKQRQFLFSSASGGQMYEYEYWFDDDGENIDVSVTSKDLDFDDPAQVKTFDFIDLVGFKQEWGTITATVYVDWENIWGGEVTDAHINLNATGALWISVLWWSPLGEEEGDSETDLLLYPFTVRIPFFARWATIQWQLESSWVQRIIEKVRINVNAEAIDVFTFDNII